MPNIIAAIKRRWKTRSVSARQHMWDGEYASGFGDRLRLPDEREHNRMLVDFMVTANKNKTILDVCCGEGAILDALEPRGYQKYVGFDFSEVALRNASKRADSRTSFVKGLAESFIPDRRFDSIVFNECLYCLADPLQLIRRYERYLLPDGAILVSLFTQTETIKLLAADLSKTFKVARQDTVTNRTGTWTCSMLMPGS
jgi:ubiquinone/menaquinone biosynthesis C-methylase UbiE